MFVVKTGDGRTRPATLPGGIADCGLRCVQRSRPRQYHCADRRRPVRTRSSPSPAVTRSSPAVLWGEARDGIQNGDPVHGYPLGMSLSRLSQVDAVSKPVLICDRFLGWPSIHSIRSVLQPPHGGDMRCLRIVVRALDHQILSCCPLSFL